MKTLFFFIVIHLCIIGCKTKNSPPLQESHKDTIVNEKPRILSYNDTAALPYDTNEDSGYFKGKIAEKIDSIEVTDTTLFFQFLKKNVSKKDISLLSHQTLSNSVLIDRSKHLRIDTFRNENTIIVSTYTFGKKESQDIFINNKKVSHYQEKDIDASTEDILSLDGSSFRHFSFKGRPYYYIGANIMDCHGMPACNTHYDLLYDISNNKLFTSSTFRVVPYLFLGDVDGNDDLDVLEIYNEGGYGDPSNDTNHFTLKVNSISRSGKLYHLKDKVSKLYFIEGNTGIDRGLGEYIFVDQYYWPVKLR